RTPGQFRTRVITDGVIPSLHIDYKLSRIKQYHKLLEALRTETTINNTRDFGIGRRIENLAELRKIGFLGRLPLDGRGCCMKWEGSGDTPPTGWEGSAGVTPPMG